MTRIKSLALLAIPFLAAAPSFAAEELSQDALIIQANIPIQGDVMEFAFNSLWTMSLDKLVRINAADNSLVVIDVKGSGAYRPPPPARALYGWRTSTTGKS